MAKFSSKDPDEDPTPPVEREVVKKVASTPVAPAPSVTVVDINNNAQSSVMAQQTVQMQMQTAQVQAEAQVGLAEVSIDKEIAEQQLQKEDEHWMKSYWRPAMGWLYMLMCFCDFIAFPIISIFIPIITKMPYVAWQSLTLSNGGLIHLSFGAILGITSYTRGQEKIAGK
jgi:hypothetical protein